jgi:hypothetical protein
MGIARALTWLGDTIVLLFYTRLLLDAGLKFWKMEGKGKNAIGIGGKTTSHEFNIGGHIHLGNNKLDMILILYHLLLDLDIE